jgi:hypothetical protein
VTVGLAVRIGGLGIGSSITHDGVADGEKRI